MSIFSNEERAEAADLMRQVHEEFSRDIVIIKEGMRTIISEDVEFLNDNYESITAEEYYNFDESDPYWNTVESTPATLRERMNQNSIANSPSYNKFYGRKKDGDYSVKRNIIAVTVKGRISYAEPKLDSFSDPSVDSQLRLKIPAGSIRIKLDEAGHDLMKSVKRLEFDGQTFGVASDFKPLGVFTTQFYVFYAAPLEESHED